ncbi:Polypeptide N-acetylgalactosaminyltransferase 11 [Hypsibius exemplaris]|uniref:Polypeptide N-acetylgalactosaminyltransferase 11 n=1 Tax=Hypsibius exemplaris TaxID=2072580 RepID=A0A1W0X9I6_HYPEX|nr:Polypeptide N-acetylgalactosaminyltransferase 11 [Hypsibius exemplaris]
MGAMMRAKRRTDRVRPEYSAILFCDHFLSSSATTFCPLLRRLSVLFCYDFLSSSATTFCPLLRRLFRKPTDFPRRSTSIMAEGMYLVLAVWTGMVAVALARPGPQQAPVQLNAGCRESALFQCVGPVISFVMSQDGQRISKVRKSGGLTEQDFAKVCRITQGTGGCMDRWIDKCLPAEQTDLRTLSQGSVEILAFCNETGSFAKFNTLTQCAEKMNETHKACGEKLRALMPAMTMSAGSPKALMNRENLQRDVCCNIKKYNSCFNKPELETICGTEAKDLTDKFIDRILTSYKCTDAVIASCPTMRLQFQRTIKFAGASLFIWLIFILKIYFLDVPSEQFSISADALIENGADGNYILPTDLSQQERKQKKWKEFNPARKHKDLGENLKTANLHAKKKFAAVESIETDDALGRDALLGMILSDDDAAAFRENEKHDFNVFLSNKIRLDRNVPDVRPPGCAEKSYPGREEKVSVIICFHNEAASALLRTVQSIVTRSSAGLIEEILLIDDASDLEDLGESLLARLRAITLVARVVRQQVRNGLIRSRIRGAREAIGAVLIFLDSHCEVNVGWLEPLLFEIALDRTAVACPVIDLIHAETLEYSASPTVRGGFNWGLHFRWDSLPSKVPSKTEPYTTPAMAGGLFAVERMRFIEIGEYDEAMDIWGGENIEFSLRVWMCGGSIKIVPCSRVGHIFRSQRPYGNDGKGDTQLTNSVRLAHTWLDGGHITKFFDARPEARLIQPGDLSQRLSIKKRLGCHSFQWYLDNVYPEATQNTTFSRVDAGGASRFTHKFKLRHLASEMCLNTNYQSKNDRATVTDCDSKGKRLTLYEPGDSSRAVVLGKKLCLDGGGECADSAGGGSVAVCAAKCHFNGGSQAWIYSKTKQSTLILNLYREVSGHIEYVVRLFVPHIESQAWRISKRYNDFATLHASLEAFGLFAELPPKRAFGNKEREFVAERQSGLQTYLSSVISNPFLLTSKAVKQFLHPGSRMTDIAGRAHGMYYG